MFCCVQNRTEIFNIYGITEVSSWATCHRLTLPVPTPSEVSPLSFPAPPLPLSSVDTLTPFRYASTHREVNNDGVPLGEPLLGTWVELRDSETGGVVTKGQGVIWIGEKVGGVGGQGLNVYISLGGEYRVCIVDEEHECSIGHKGKGYPVGQEHFNGSKEHEHRTGLEGKRCPVGQERLEHPSGHMRCSGDWGGLDDLGHLVYAGRTDRQIKRWGHRVNLDVIQVSVMGYFTGIMVALACSHDPATMRLRMSWKVNNAVLIPTENYCCTGLCVFLCGCLSSYTRLHPSRATPLNRTPAEGLSGASCSGFISEGAKSCMGEDEGGPTFSMFA